MKVKVVINSNLKGLKMIKQGKVRDIYQVDDKLLIVATDRISAFDVVLPNGIPYKGIILTQLSKFWFGKFKEIIENHLISTELSDLPPVFKSQKNKLAGRFMLCRTAEPLPVECVVRGYISGSAWAEYLQNGSICGIKLPPGLKESDKLPEPIFTPATKAEKGEHDINITFNEVKKIIGEELAKKVYEVSLKIYTEAQKYAESRGIIISDTKFEFGLKDGKLMLIDEVLTPDSSRFWPVDEYKPGGPQKSFDKQFVRDYLISINFNRKPPAPELPEDIVQKTSEKYLEAYRRLTGKELKLN
jgi:phosphoribosylaminoimidazole-succinocarboxamide synthase